MELDNSDLLFRAGSALKLDFFRFGPSGLWIELDGEHFVWNSLENDEDAMQLSRELKITAVISDDIIQAGPTGKAFTIAERIHSDMALTLRIAITKAAALMYKEE